MRRDAVIPDDDGLGAPSDAALEVLTLVDVVEEDLE